MNLKPHLDMVLIKLEPYIGQTKGGLFIPETAQDKQKAQPRWGKVIATGPGRNIEGGHFRENDCKPGDRVLINRHGGMGIEINGEDHKVIPYGEIIAFDLDEDWPQEWRQ